jgi:hypothetical protein
MYEIQGGKYMTRQIQDGASSATQAMGPSQVVQAFSQAVQAQDAQTVKRLLSGTSLKMLEGAAGSKGMSMDEFITKGGDMPLRETPEIRNETIEDDLATMEVNVSNGWERLALVKEGGDWKIAFDK